MCAHAYTHTCVRVALDFSVCEKLCFVVNLFVCNIGCNIEYLVSSFSIGLLLRRICRLRHYFLYCILIDPEIIIFWCFVFLIVISFHRKFYCLFLNCKSSCTVVLAACCVKKYRLSNILCLKNISGMFQMHIDSVL